MTTIDLKNVLVKGEGAEDITVQVVDFDRYNDAHVKFAYNYSDMLFRAPSPFSDVSEAAKEYVKKFLVHTEADEKDPKSTFSKIYNDLRACRTLFHKEKITLDLNNFFENA